MSVLFQNSQWRVTEAGLECEPAAYLIPPETLADQLEDQRVITWHLLMHTKAWVDFDAFCEAYRKAVELLGVDIDAADVALSERVARGVHKRVAQARERVEGDPEQARAVTDAALRSIG